MTSDFHNPTYLSVNSVFVERGWSKSTLLLSKFDVNMAAKWPWCALVLLCMVGEGNFQTENPTDRLSRFSNDQDFPLGGDGRVVSDGFSPEPPRRRYPSRSYADTAGGVKAGPPDRDYNVRPSADRGGGQSARPQSDRRQFGQSANPRANDPGYVFRQQQGQSFPYEPYPSTTTTTTPRHTTTRRSQGGEQTTKRVDPFADPDRYRQEHCSLKQKREKKEHF